jgi:hypothetical protein
MNAMSGTDPWTGPSALAILVRPSPGAMPQAGMGCTVGARMIRAAFLGEIVCVVGARLNRVAFLGRMGCVVGNRMIRVFPLGEIT